MQHNYVFSTKHRRDTQRVKIALVRPRKMDRLSSQAGKFRDSEEEPIRQLERHSPERLGTYVERRNGSLPGRTRVASSMTQCVHVDAGWVKVKVKVTVKVIQVRLQQ